ncbi:MAG TPA: hypothetical protein VF756_03205 [Thermoanaerobaculia bacterium]
MTGKAHLAIPVLLLTLAACDRESTVPPETADQTPSPAVEATPEQAPVGPISSRGGAVPGDQAAQAGEGIDFDMPANWQSETPETSMRMAQAAIPGASGPGLLAVFYFGPGGGGGVEDNIQRWIDQMEPAPGSDLQPETFQTPNGYKVTWVDVAGVLKPSSMGMGPETAQPNSRLFGAVVEGPGGPWFFKVTGPDATLSAERENFLSMLRSVREK